MSYCWQLFREANTKTRDQIVSVLHYFVTTGNRNAGDSIAPATSNFGIYPVEGSDKAVMMKVPATTAYESCAGLLRLLKEHSETLSADAVGNMDPICMLSELCECLDSRCESAFCKQEMTDLRLRALWSHSGGE